MPPQSRFTIILLSVVLLAVAGAVSLWAASILRTPPHSDVLWLIEGLSLPDVQRQHGDRT